jgi:4-amino-4-deoxy-L-arabinose transferase-like glycosyltransferase
LIFIGETRVAWQLEFEEIANNLINHGQYYFSFYGLGESGPTSFIPPVYPLLLALTRFLIPSSIDWMIKAIQILASSLIILGLYRLTREVGESAPQGILAALFWAIYPPAIAYASDLSTVTLETFFLIFGLLLLLRSVKCKSLRMLFPAGILLSLASLTRSTWLVAILIALVWLLVFVRADWIIRAKFGLLFILAVSLTLAPWVFYNYKTQGTIVLTSTNGGLNFWIGNNPQATGEYVFPTELDHDLVIGAAHRTELTRDQFFYSQGLEFIRNSPGKFITLLGRKTLYALFFRPNIGSNYESAQFSFYNLVIASFVAAWLALIPFALFGLFHLKTHWQQHSLLMMIFLGNVANSVLFFTGTRFRTPVDGFAMIWAAIGLTVLSGIWKRRKISHNKGSNQKE